MADVLTLDTNILMYAVDQRDLGKQNIAAEVIRQAQSERTILTSITLGEFFHAAPRKLGLSRATTRGHLMDYIALFPTRNYNLDHVIRAAEENQAGRFAFWDAVMLACAEDAGCTICLSEDMHDGARLGNIVVRNPFGPRGLNEEIRAFLMP